MRSRLAVCLGFAGLAALFLHRTLFTGLVLLPVDNLFAFAPWDSYAAQFGLSTPHNELLSDAVFQNFAWKKFARNSLAAGQLPLWNPYILGGQPFLAGGQSGLLYPLGALFLLLPLAQAYSVYTALHLALAGIFTFAFLRAIGATRLGAAVSGITFAFSGFMVVGFIWPMVIGVAVWLPLALLATERLIQLLAEVPLSTQHGIPPGLGEGRRGTLVRSILWGAAFTTSLALQFLAGHAEISSYLVIAVAVYAAGRLLVTVQTRHSRESGNPAAPVDSRFRGNDGTEGGTRPLETELQHRCPPAARGGSALRAVGTGGLLAALAMAGGALAAPQLLPFLELAGHSSRSGATSYQQVIDWAYRPIQAATFLMPDFFGNPTHSSYLNLLSWERVAVATNYLGEPVRAISWGAKNYVEGAAYVGILPLLLAAVALLARRDRYSWTFVFLAILSLAFTFGTPLYSLPFRLIPGYDQLHTPFRWIFLYSFSVAVLAGLGATAVRQGAPQRSPADPSRGGSPQTRPATAGHRTPPGDRPQGTGRIGGDPALLGAFGPRASAGDARRLVAGFSLTVGIALAGFLAVSLLFFETSLHLAETVLQGSPGLQQAFPDGRALYFYQFRNVALLALLLIAGGAAVTALGKHPTGKPGTEPRRHEDTKKHQAILMVLRAFVPSWLSKCTLAPGLVLALLVADLFFFGIGFNAASDPAGLDFTPPAVQFLKADQSLYRVSSFGPDKTFAPNAPMLYGIQDVRGYDSVIPRAYVDFMDQIEGQRLLLSNRIDAFLDPSSLDSPLLDLLNVKYLVTREPLTSPHLTPAYEGEVRIYRNESVLPRAFVVEQAIAAADSRDALRLLSSPGFDPSEVVVLEQAPGDGAPGTGRGVLHTPAAGTPDVDLPSGRSTGDAGALQRAGLIPIPRPPSPDLALTPTLSLWERGNSPPSQGERGNSSLITHRSSLITSYTPNRVEIDVNGPGPGYLVLSDGYYPGWEATVDGSEAPVLRANGAFRAVQLPPGRHQVVFEFKPFSFRLGLFASLLAASLLLLALGFAALLRFYPRGQHSPFQRVARNSLFPMGTSLLNKLLDLGFAIYTFRVLGPQGVGKYTFAVVVIGYLDILANFGLGTLLTREVARDRRAGNRYLGNSLAARIAFWAISLAVVALLLGPAAGPLGITPDVALAILLLTLALLPSLIAATLSALFMAYEKFEYPAAVTVLTNVLKIALGVVALATGWGFVGLAGVSVLVNLVTVAILLALVLAILYRPRLEFQLAFSWKMLRVSYPLMLNNLLNSVFFRVDSLMIKPMVGDAALGWYGTAYKFVDGLGIISSSFTLALFPLLSQYAQSARDSLARTFGLALKLLLVVSLPISVGTTLIAPEIILLFAGPDYLPHSAIALQILIWFLPFSFANGLTQYLLIAINQQRFITISFVAATAFNLAANLLLIPVLGYAGAAITTVLSEWVLMIPFWRCVRRHLPPIPILSIAWRPAAAAAVMGLEVWALRDWNLPLAVALAPPVYAGALLALRGFEKEELALLGGLLPWRRLHLPADREESRQGRSP